MPELKKDNNLYKYKIDKSMQVETHYFLKRGRISRKAFFLRLLLTAIIVGAFCYGYYRYFYWIMYYLIKMPGDEYAKMMFMIYEWVTIIVLIIMSVFLIIQSIKRLHDVNVSGWYLLVPLYNIYLLFKPGDNDSNDYGIPPIEDNRIYFDDEKTNTKQLNKDI